MKILDGSYISISQDEHEEEIEHMIKEMSIMAANYVYSNIEYYLDNSKESLIPYLPEEMDDYDITSDIINISVIKRIRAKILKLRGIFEK